MSGAGMLIEHLDTVGVAPGDATRVVFTRARPGHIRGLLDEFDELMPGEAACTMSRTDRDHLRVPDTVNTVGEERAGA